MASQIQTLTIAYQSVLIAVTAILVAVFIFFTILLIRASKHNRKSNQFIMVVGGVISISFLIRCILFVILLAAEIISSIYLFITLFVTEIIPMTILLIQFYFFYVLKAISSATSAGTQHATTSNSEDTS